MILSDRMATYLPKTAYDWSLKHVLIEGDNDLLPPLQEFESIHYSWNDVLPLLAKLDIENYEWGGERRFVVPKERLSFRSATQLDPVDSLLFSAIMWKYGAKIEARRIPVADRRVFSHRFAPSPNGRFYAEEPGWHEFWRRSRDLAEEHGWVVVADLTDYYNQIYHHVLENELKEAGLPNGIRKTLKALVTHLTQAVSRGLPVGPHGTHLLAEAALSPIDRSLLAHGLEFCRFVDDIHIFCESEEDAIIALNELATIVDQQQRLTLQRQKTRVLPADEFWQTANEMLEDRPLDEEEDEILDIIKKYSKGKLYTFVNLTDVSDEDLETFRAEKLAPLLERYLQADPVEYGNVRWLLRRLAQFGFPGALNFVIDNVDELTPALGDIAHYILRASPHYAGDWPEAGESILRALTNRVIGHSEYARLVLLHLFGRVPALNQTNRITALYAAAPPAVRREIVFAARAAGNAAWLRERKAEFESADPWLRRAIIAGASALAGDEGDIWLMKVRNRLTFLEKLMVRWAFKNRKLKIGELRIK